jgi:sugar phosphate isomerase/epimerase
MNRRQFLVGSTMAVGAAARVWGQGGAAATDAKMARMAIMAYSFSSILKYPGGPTAAERTLDIRDLPQMFADKYKVHNVEMQHNYFESTETAFLKDFVALLAKSKSKVSNINLELGNMSIAATTPALRAQAADLTKAWIDHAIVLGSPRVMINQGRLTQENKATAIETLQRMTAYGKSKNIMVGAEPRGDDHKLLTEVLKAGGAYSNPDIGNFQGDQATQHEAMRLMFPFTDGNCHIKALNPPKYDLAAAVRLTKELGYKGLYSIENEQQGDPYKNVQDVIDVVLANM